jgi:RimJ/RimL family protein N-acetyltransferase
METDIHYFTDWWHDIELIKLTSGDFKPINEKQVLKYFNSVILSSDNINFMVEVDSQTIGHISLNKRPHKWLETQIVIGNKKFRGLGYGPKSIMLMINELSHKGIEKIYLNVRPENIRAIKAYQSVGFKQVGCITETGNPNQPQLIRMELYLSAK